MAVQYGSNVTNVPKGGTQYSRSSGGGSSRSSGSAPSRGQVGWIDPIDGPGDTTFTSKYGQPTAAQLADAAGPGVPKTITSSALTPAPSVTLPPPPPTPNIGTQAMTQAAGTAAAATATTPATDPTSTTTDAETAFQTYLKSIQAPPDTAAIYKKDLADSGVTQDQQAVNTYQSQLNAITAKAQADKLSLVGQGNGVPNAIIGGQQAEIDREAAIQALPVSAQLSAAQGNLTMAKDNLDTLFKLHVADAQNQVSYRNSLITAVYNFATDQQKAQLDDLKTKNAQAFTTQQNNLNYAQSLATAALSNGQSGLAAQLMKLDPNDPNYRDNIATLAGGIQVIKAPSSAQTTAEIGSALSDANAAIAAGADPIAVRSAFLAKHPSSSSNWNAYFAADDSTKITYPTPAVPSGPGFWDSIKGFFSPR